MACLAMSSECLPRQVSDKCCLFYRAVNNQGQSFSFIIICNIAKNTFSEGFHIYSLYFSDPLFPYDKTNHKELSFRISISGREILMWEKMFSLFLDVITEAAQIIVIWLKIQHQLTFFLLSADRANIYRCSCII